MVRKILLNALYFSGIQALCKPFMQGMGSVIMLHHVRNIQKKPFSPNYHLTASPEFLDKLIIRLKKKKYDFISMDEMVERLENPEAHKGKRPFICITLDDGYRNNLENAIPIFRRHNVPYLIYLATGLTEGETPLWWDDLERVIEKTSHIYVDMPEGRLGFDISTPAKKTKVYKELVVYLIRDVSEPEARKIVSDLAKAYKIDQLAYAREQLMDWSEIHELQKDPLCTIGAHTISHYALNKLTEDEVRYEMEQGRAVLKSETGIAPEHFAYPYGYHQVAGEREFELAKECGFKTATTTRHGVVYKDHIQHMTALPRISINGHHQSIHYINTLLSGITTLLSNFGKRLSVK